MRITLDRFTYDGHLIEIHLEQMGQTFRVSPRCAGIGFAAAVAYFMDNLDNVSLDQAAKSDSIRMLVGRLRRDVESGQYAVL